MMSWLDRHRLKLYVRNSIWVFPVLNIVAGLIAVALLYPTGNALRTFLILASLGAFLGFEIIMATEPRRKAKG